MKKITKGWILLLVCMLTVTACAKSSSATLVADIAVSTSFTDALGHELSVSNPKNVVVCTGSFAEVWLLAGGELAGVTQDAYDEHLFTVPETAVTVGAVKSPSVEQIIAMNADLVILSSKIAEHIKLYEPLKGAGIATAYFDVETFDDYLAMLKISTDITGNTDLHEQNGNAVRSRIENAIQKSKEKEQPTVLYIRAFSTGAKAKGSDTMTGKMLSDLGCKNIVDENPSLLEDLSMEKIISLDPEFIFVTTMGESTEDALDSLKKGIQSNPAWSGLSAVKNDRYIVLQKELFHYKPNARWGESYEILADILYGK